MRRALALLAAAFVQCGGGLANAPVGPAPKCPDVSDRDAALAFDWAASYGLDAASAAKIRAGVAAATDLRRLAAQVDADLKTGCGGLAADLGAPAHFESGKEACDAGLAAIRATRSKLGHATIALDTSAPKCGAPLDVFAACLAKCDAARERGAPSACEPGKIQGTCDGNCSGTCDTQGGAKCSGTCSGKCDGRCKGRCEGAPSEGVCSGTCTGSCTGVCSGACDVAGKAPCSGTCTGSCDVAMKSPRCTGEASAPGASAECRAECDAWAQAKADCTPAHVGVTVRGGDEALAKKFAAALENDLPLVLKVSVGMAERVKQVARDVTAVVDGARAAARAPAGSPKPSALEACVSSPFSAGIAAAAALEASVATSVAVGESVR